MVSSRSHANLWCINFASNVAGNGKYLKRGHVTPLLRDLKWNNFNTIWRLNEASFMYKNLYVSADSNMKKINFDLRNKVSQRISRNGSDVHIDYRITTVGQKASCLSIRSKAVEFNPDEYQKLKYNRFVQKSYVPTPLRAPITTWKQTQTFLIKHSTFTSSFTMWKNSIFLKSMLIKSSE